jgi:hypothetical protein
MSKTDCINSLRTALTNTSLWRLNLADRDPRCERAARRLARLAEDTANLSDSHWAALEPHFKSDRWNECLRQTSRLLGFAVKKMSLGYFVKKLAGRLSEPTPA